MSNFNLSWLKENLKDDAVIFYIGAAGLNEVIEIRRNFPNATIHAFECSTYWVEKYQIFEMAKQHNIKYHQLAVSNIDGEVKFYPSDKRHDEIWPVSSSIFEMKNNVYSLSFSDPITVQSTTLATFCKQHNVYPDFIHIDIQGAEHAAFSNIGEYRPKIIWTEVSEFTHYDTGITYNDFYQLLTGMGYKKIIKDGPDELYVLEKNTISDYVSNTNKMPSWLHKLTDQQKKIKFVFKEDSNDEYGIHGHKKTSFYNILNGCNMVDKIYRPDNLPTETFIYEYTHDWRIATVEFFGKNGFLEMDPCPEKVLQRIKEKTAYLFITIPFESPLSSGILAIIHAYFKRHELPASQVVYFTSCLNGQELYNHYCESIHEAPLFNLEYAMDNLSMHCHLAQKFKQETYKAVDKKKTFLMFNRRWSKHPHRTLFLYNIYKMNMLDDFYISFTKQEIENPECNYGDIVIRQYNNYFFRSDNQLDLDTLDELEDKLPLILDTTDFVSSSLMFEEFDNTKNFYDDSFINVVAETYFWSDASDIVHITEKTFKPMLYRQPFIVLGPTTILKRLQKLGFKTFNDIWDESYDETYDHTERFYKILNLCKEIHCWSNTKKIEVMEKCKDILEHNFSLLLNFRKNKIVAKDIINKYKL